jgi:uncharacterized protein YfiM (DUF2279 family)
LRTASRSAHGMLSALVTAGLAAALVAPAAASASPKKGSSLPPGTVGFAVPTVVDQFRPGYEPDNAVAPQVKGNPYSGSTFVSMPNGFSTTMSYVWRSDDGNQTFHPTEGNVFGKPTTCVGGGDTELQIDPVNGDVYLADLQGLTNFSNSASSDGGHTWNTTCTAVPGTGVDRQWEAIDDNGGTSAVGPGPNDGRLYFDYDNVDQDATGSGNQLVMNESLDGVHFGAYCQGGGSGGTTVSGCAVPPAMISPNESIPGNVIVDNIPGNPYQHRVFAIHTGDNGSSVVLSYCSGAKGDNTAAEVAQDCTDPTAFTPGQNPNDPMDRTNRYWHDVYVQKPGSYSTGNLFPSIAIDRAGNLYTVWSQYPTGSNGVDGPGAIMMSVSTDGGSTWSSATPISQSGLNEAVMPWIVAGDRGRVGVAYYAANDTIDGNVGPDASNKAVWNLFYAFSTHALTASGFHYTQVNEPGHPIKFGDISTGGLGGAEDRSLGDFFQVHAGPNGQAVISYVDDTSADRNTDTCGGCGETPPEAAGPVMVATQNRGPSLYAGAAIPATPTNDQGSVSVPATQAAKSAFLAAAGQDVAAAANQQLTAARVTSDGTNLTVTLTTADPNLANDLSVSPTLGGPVANWMVRWAAPSYSEQSTDYTNCPGAGSACDGNIFYVGMESDGGGSPSFYYGSTQALTTTHAKYFEYPATNTADLSAKINGSSIQWTLPLKDVGGPAAGQGLYSITGFTSTQLQPSPSSTATVPANNTEVGDANIPNLIAATPPFDYLIGSSTAGGNVPEAPYAVLLVLIPLGGASIWMLRRRSSTRKVTA